MKLARDISFIVFLLTTVFAFQARSVSAGGSCTDVWVYASCAQVGDEKKMYCEMECENQGHCVADDPAWTCWVDIMKCECRPLLN